MAAKSKSQSTRHTEKLKENSLEVPTRNRTTKSHVIQVLPAANTSRMVSDDVVERFDKDENLDLDLNCRHIDLPPKQLRDFTARSSEPSLRTVKLEPPKERVVEAKISRPRVIHVKPAKDSINLLKTRPHTDSTKKVEKSSGSENVHQKKIKTITTEKAKSEQDASVPKAEECSRPLKKQEKPKSGKPQSIQVRSVDEARIESINGFDMTTGKIIRNTHLRKCVTRDLGCSQKLDMAPGECPALATLQSLFDNSLNRCSSPIQNAYVESYCTPRQQSQSSSMFSTVKKRVWKDLKKKKKKRSKKKKEKINPDVEISDTDENRWKKSKKIPKILKRIKIEL